MKYFGRCSDYRLFLWTNSLRCSQTKRRCCLCAVAVVCAQTVRSNLPDQVMRGFDKGLGDQTLVEWEVLTYWCHCSTLWRRPSHGRRLPVRPARSPGTEDIWCCAAVSSRGRMSRSSWILGESFYRDISWISSVVLRRGTDPTESLPARSQLMRLGYPPHTLPLVAFIPQKPRRDPVYQALNGAGPRSSGLCLWVPAVLTLTMFTALLNVHDDARTLDWGAKSYTTFTPNNFVKLCRIYRKQDSFAFKIKRHVG